MLLGEKGLKPTSEFLQRNQIYIKRKVSFNQGKVS